MGHENRSDFTGLAAIYTSPETDEIEVSLVGPGYGECILIHIGNQRWVIVDSCLDANRQPTALNYLIGLGLDPSEVVCLIVATHWHDDHIRGMAQLVEMCGNAIFCCASALVDKEFLAFLAAVEGRPATPDGSGARELYRVFGLLSERGANRDFALSNRRIFNQTGCAIWTLSPSDAAYETFLRRIGRIRPEIGETKKRVPALEPNDASVVLLIELDETAVLLGADLERRGWMDILDNDQRPDSKASVFKVPHHGSENAHVDRAWSELLTERPSAVVTPWRRGRGSLPADTDIQRILSFSDRAYITASPTMHLNRNMPRGNRMVERTIRESGAAFRRVSPSDGMVRLRRKPGLMADWNVELIGSAQQLAPA